MNQHRAEFSHYCYCDCSSTCMRRIWCDGRLHNCKVCEEKNPLYDGVRQTPHQEGICPICKAPPLRSVYGDAPCECGITNGNFFMM